MTKKPKDIAASVRARLLALAKKRGEDFQLVLIRYVNERLLFRLGQSRHASRFVLKGATLFMLWTDTPHRATRDIDLLGYGAPSGDRIRETIEEIIALEVDDDGVVFDESTLDVEPIREDQEYGGIRAVLFAAVDGARARVQVDVGFGDVITPAAVEIDVPTLLESPAPHLRAYPRETVVAEKLEALVQLGAANSRMKDFFDLVVLSRQFEFDGAILTRSIEATFGRRKTPIPVGLPIGLTKTFAADPSKVSQWSAFVRKTAARDVGALTEVVDEIATFLHQPLQSAARAETFALRWPPRGPWLR